MTKKHLKRTRSFSSPVRGWVKVVSASEARLKLETLPRGVKLPMLSSMTEEFQQGGELFGGREKRENPTEYRNRLGTADNRLLKVAHHAHHTHHTHHAEGRGRLDQGN